MECGAQWFDSHVCPMSTSVTPVRSVPSLPVGVQPGSAVDIVQGLLTALERSAPADRGYGEIEYRRQVVDKAKHWLQRMAPNGSSSSHSPETT